MSDVLRHAQTPKAIWDQHEAILAAILAGDEDRAEHLASSHIEIAVDALTAAAERSEQKARNKSV